MQQFRQLQPYCGVSMVWGNLRARGIKVTRERIRNMLRMIDPLGSILRCFPGTIRRQPYTVPGPNSLWHIGETHGDVPSYSRLGLYMLLM